MSLLCWSPFDGCPLTQNRIWTPYASLQGPYLLTYPNSFHALSACSLGSVMSALCQLLGPNKLFPELGPLYLLFHCLERLFFWARPQLAPPHSSGFRLNVTFPDGPSLTMIKVIIRLSKVITSAVMVLVCCFSHVWLFATLWTIACQAPLFMGFSRQEYWSG